MFDASELAALGSDAQASSARIAPECAAAGRATAKATEADMIQRAPVLTGATRDSITATVVVSTGGIDIEIGPTTRWSEYLENGTSVMAPEPFVAPAFDANVSSLTTGVAAVGSRVLS